MQKLMTDNMQKLRTDLDIIIIDHDAQLKATAENIKQDIRTELLLELQEEKIK